MPVASDWYSNINGPPGRHVEWAFENLRGDVVGGVLSAPSRQISIGKLCVLAHLIVWARLRSIVCHPFHLVMWNRTDPILAKGHGYLCPVSATVLFPTPAC